MKLALLLAAAAATSTSAGPTVAQFNAAMAAACPAPPAQTRNVRCSQPDPRSIQFSCTYELRSAEGAWISNSATLQVAEGEWVWIDGPTLCDEEDASLN